MIRIEKVSSIQQNPDILMDAQIRRLEFIENARLRASKVEESHNADTNEKSRLKEDLKSKEQEKNNPEFKTEKKQQKTSVSQEPRLNFVLSQETGKVLIQLLNPETGEIIREIPSEKMLKKMTEIFKNNGESLVVDQKV